ncbi:cytochrome P450 [Aspergillus karnatakaensis]|uniref:cytochrome P450 n=1 Tax=Aspergillus karnatakaensis TaxID=1810916 RepID=UPI003CCE1EC8
MPLLSTYIGAALAGIFSHVAYFKRGEHHLYGPLYIKIFLVTITAGTVALSFAQRTAWTASLSTVSSLVSAYLLGLYGSLLVYRIFLHPLCNFPGPFGARISTGWIATQVKKNNHHIVVRELHRKYGPIVRVGSSDISVIHPKAVDIVYGPSSRSYKGTGYEVSYPEFSLQLMRDPAQHHARRRVWSPAFSDRMLRGYEERIRGYREQLVNRLSEMSGQPVSIRKWFNLYSFDVMGDMAFGKGFGGLERGEQHWAIQLLSSFVDPIGWYLPTWSFILLTAIPGLSGEFWKFPEFCKEKTIERFRNKPEIPDLSSSLFAPLKGRDITEISPEEKVILFGDARTIVIAGSDTTSGTLSAIFYELVRNPEEIKKLRTELAPYANADGVNGEFLHSKIAHLEHLNGVINEALRLYPAVPSFLQRRTPPEGITIEGLHIPGEMHIFCPLYTIGRSELAYDRPEEFIPERWYKWPELVKDKAAFAPFSAGEFNCIGRPLALMNLRTTLARLVMQFDFKFAPGEDGSHFLGDAKDNFVFYFGELNMVFTRR